MMNLKKQSDKNSEKSLWKVNKKKKLAMVTENCIYNSYKRISKTLFQTVLSEEKIMNIH